MTKFSPQIPSSSCSTDQETKFTLRTANAMLPLVRSIVKDIVELSVEISQIRRRLEELGVEQAPDDSQDVYSTEVTAIRDSVDRQSDRVRECVAELNELGVWPRSLIAGYVDFPAMREGKRGLLVLAFGRARSDVLASGRPTMQPPPIGGPFTDSSVR